MAWSMDIRGDGGVEGTSLAADAAEREAGTDYVRRWSSTRCVAPRRRPGSTPRCIRWRSSPVVNEHEDVTETGTPPP
jgi:hypothetical protein